MERQIIVKAKDGLHARPAAIFVKAASDVGSPVTIGMAGQTPVPANSILAVMGLGVRCGDTVILSSESEQALDVLDGLLSHVEE
ncbi:MAG: HPr family phosphocarrier protein [Micrococcales bacterium]|nr:HPr family phosphocarrier protein [Micrococcales bacterium]